MQDFTIAIYCFLDDLLQKIGIELDKKRKWNHAQIMTGLVVSCKYFYGNHLAACDYLCSHYGFPRLDKSNFNRAIHGYNELISELIYILSSVFKHLNLSSEYIIDSFPVSVCKNIRINRCRIIEGEEYRGYNASKRSFFYGFKVRSSISTVEGIPVEISISSGSTHDNTAFQAMNIDLPPNAELYADAAYINYLQKELLETQGIKLKFATKKNSVNRNTWFQELEIDYFRRPIENVFSQIVAKFPAKIHAVTKQGFVLKVIMQILTFMLTNFIFH